MEAIVFYVLEKNTDYGWQNVDYYAHSQKEKAIEIFEILTEHGDLDYHLKVVILDGASTDWGVIMSSNGEVSEEHVQIYA